MQDLAKKPQQLSSLKRKRPPGVFITIPTVLREIRADVSETGNSDGVVSVSEAGVGVVSKKGKKKFMEDCFKIVSSCPDGIKGFFGVYDGHGGRKAANFASQNLHTNIFEMLKNSTTDKSKEEAVQAGYLKTDNDFLKQDLTSGSCCVTAFIVEDKIVVSNLGDCRAVLCRGGVAEALTIDHSPGNDDEKRRIESKGGYVELHRGTWRVHGILAVSRSIGDALLKDWVIGEPDTKILQLSSDMEFLILASDGFWDKVGNQEATDIVNDISWNRNKPRPRKHDQDEKDAKFFPVPNSSPVPNSQRDSLIEQNKSPIKRNIVKRKEKEDEFPSENDGPPLKIRKVSVQYQDQENTKIFPKEDELSSENEGSQQKAIKVPVQYQDQENTNSKKQTNSCVLVSACNELVNLAQSRGSLDDITVMIIDLNQFK